MQDKITIRSLTGWLLGLTVFTIGLLNLFLVHTVPGLIGLILSLLFFPPVNDLLKKHYGFVVPFAIKILLALAIFWFTLGVSDLGDMID